MLSGSDAVEQTILLRKAHDAERDQLDVVRRYWKGKQSLPRIIPKAAPREVREMAKIARVNVCDIVVDTLAQSLLVEGFRAGRDATNLAMWDAWQANRFDRGQTGVHRAALAYRASYVSVLPGDDHPVIRGHSPRAMTVLYGEDPDWPLWALERWDKDTFRLYDDEATYFVGEGERGELAFIEARRHGMGVCPVVRYLDAQDLDADDDIEETAEATVLGQVAPLMPLQDQIDLTTFGLLVAQHYSAFRQRYILGWVAESEKEKMEAHASVLWTFDVDDPNNVKVGEFSETSLKGYIDSREAVVRYAATLSQTPVHELIGQMVNLSAEALAAAEAGRDRKVDERKVGFGESHEQVFQLVGMLTDVEVPDDSQVVWRDTSARAFAATVDALGKLAQMLGVPRRALWERIPGVTQQDMSHWEGMAAEGDAFARLAEMLERQAGNGQTPTVPTVPAVP